jgi:hypothetical protein
MARALRAVYFFGNVESWLDASTLVSDSPWIGAFAEAKHGRSSKAQTGLIDRSDALYKI